MIKACFRNQFDNLSNLLDNRNVTVICFAKNIDNGFNKEKKVFIALFTFQWVKEMLI